MLADIGISHFAQSDLMIEIVPEPFKKSQHVLAEIGISDVAQINLMIGIVPEPFKKS